MPASPRVMNVQAALAGFTPPSSRPRRSWPRSAGGSDHPNFMAHPYTCDGKQLRRGDRGLQRLPADPPGAGNGKIIAVDPNWVTAAPYYKG